MSEFGEFGEYSCSATAIAPSVILTAAHCEGIVMEVDGVPAKTLKKDVNKDLLLLYAPVKGGYVPVAESGTLSVGDKVVTYGYPLGLFVGYVPVYTKGKVQGYAVGETKYGTERITGWVMSVLPITHGNSGGGIFKRVNGEWRVVSVVSLGVDHLSISPSLEMVRSFVNGS